MEYKTRTHQSFTNQFYQICEECNCEIFHINLSNYCPDCGRKITRNIKTYEKNWIKLN